MTPIEIERKFLIKMPHPELFENANKKKITQTYLTSNDGSTVRVRKIVKNSCVSYIKTTKKRISDLSHFEDEYAISEHQYNEELKFKDTSKNAIEKTRYCIPCGPHILEIDVYPFWADRAILEIELSSENEPFDIPESITVIKEVSGDGRYKNTNLAKEIPMDIVE